MQRNEVSGLVLKDCVSVSWYWSFNGVFYDQNRLLCENPPFRLILYAQSYPFVFLFHL